jgi:hypothetical protein
VVGPAAKTTAKSSMTAAPAVAASAAPAAASRRHVCGRYGHGSSNAKDHDRAQQRTLRASSRHRALSWRRRSNRDCAEFSRSDREFEDFGASRCFSSLRIWAPNEPAQPLRELQRQTGDPAVSSHVNLLLRKRSFRRNSEMDFQAELTK